MRGLTSTIILVVILSGLGSYIYFVDSKKPAAGAGSDTPKAKVFAIDTEKITDLTLTYQGETSVLKKAAAGWTMVEPSATDADAAEAMSLAQALSNIESSRTIDENPATLAEYGLEKPTVTIAFKGEGNVSGSLSLGDKTAMQGDMYAIKGGDKKVFLVPAFQESTFTKKPFDLRDRKLLKFDREKADTLVMSRAGEDLEMARTGSDWRVVKPGPARGDYSSVEGLITRLSTSNMATLVEPDAKDLAKYGLDKPSMTITVGAGSAKSALQVGKTENNLTYARDASRPLVFTIDTTLQGDTKKSFGDYRRKEFFEFRPFSVTRIRAVLDAPGGPKIYEFEKAKAAKASDPDLWKVAKQGGESHEVKSSSMDDLLGRLSDLKAQSYADAKTKTGLDKPALVISVSYDEGKFERVRFGEVGETAFALRDGESGAGKIEKLSLEGALLALDTAVMPPPPAPAAPPAQGAAGDKK